MTVSGTEHATRRIVQKPVSHPKGALDRLLDPLGIKLVPVKKRRGPAESHARATMKAIRKTHDDGFLVFILRVIRQTKGNRDALDADTIGALADIFSARPDWIELGGKILDIFDRINLGQLRKKAVTLRPWPVRASLRILIYLQMERLIHDNSNAA